MAADQSGKPTFPVWVGSLDESVSEKQLFRKFSKYGSVSSVKIQRDGATGKSRGFGWVNFHTRESADHSAAKMAGVALRGNPIKTRGPTELEKKGLFSPPKADFRPLTDCSFFMQGKRCNKGANVRPYFSPPPLSLYILSSPSSLPSPPSPLSFIYPFPPLPLSFPHFHSFSPLPPSHTV